MFRPVGSQPSAVYWRRRLLLIVTVVVVLILLVVSAKVLFGSDGTTPSGLGSTSTTPHPSTSRSTSTKPVSSTTSPSHSSSAASSSTSSSPTAATPKTCVSSQLAVRAVSDKTAYKVGDKPHLMLQVTDSAASSCVQDLADKQIELTVYNGESRVWGSHDCKVLAGTNPMVLAPSVPVRITVVWSGLSSKDNSAHTTAACGPRQVVGAGTYTLIAKLGSKTGQAAQFTIS